MLKKFFILNLLIISIVFMTGCDENKKNIDNNDIQKILRVGTSADYPPFEFLRDGVIVGFDIDFANAIAEKINRHVVIKDMPFYSLLPALQKGDIDIALSGITANIERSENMDFSVQYYKSNFSLLILEKNVKKGTNSIEGKIIGVQTGSVMHQWLTEQKKDDFQVEIISMDNTLDLIEDLKNERINGILLDQNVADNLVKISKTPMKALKMDNAQIDFSNPYAINEFNLVVMKSSGIKKSVLLPGMSVGIVKDNTKIKNWLIKQKNYGLQINIVEVEEIFDLVQRLKDGKVNVMLCDDNTADDIINNRLIGGPSMRKLPMSEILIDGFVIGLKKDNPLVEDINRAIQSLHKDGTLKKLQEKWEI